MQRVRDWQFVARLTARGPVAQGPAVRTMCSLVVAETEQQARQTVQRNLGPQSATVGFWDLEVLSVQPFERPRFNFWENQRWEG